MQWGREGRQGGGATSRKREIDKSGGVREEVVERS
jgi:hypothetical protein